MAKRPKPFRKNSDESVDVVEIRWCAGHKGFCFQDFEIKGLEIIVEQT